VADGLNTVLILHLSLLKNLQALFYSQPIFYMIFAYRDLKREYPKFLKPKYPCTTMYGLPSLYVYDRLMLLSSVL